MKNNKIKELFNSYGFEVVARGTSGFFNMSIDEVFKVFNRYGDDVELFELEQIHGVTRKEYKELQKLKEEKCSISTFEYEGKIHTGPAHMRCCGTTKTGNRCKNVEPHSSLDYKSYDEQLKILKSKDYYCKVHANQRDVLLQKAVKAVYGDK